MVFRNGMKMQIRLAMVIMIVVEAPKLKEDLNLNKGIKRGVIYRILD